MGCCGATGRGKPCVPFGSVRWKALPSTSDAEKRNSCAFKAGRSDCEGPPSLLSGLAASSRAMMDVSREYSKQATRSTAGGYNRQKGLSSSRSYYKRRQ